MVLLKHGRIVNCPECRLSLPVTLKHSTFFLNSTPLILAGPIHCCVTLAEARNKCFPMTGIDDLSRSSDDDPDLPLGVRRRQKT